MASDCGHAELLELPASGLEGSSSLAGDAVVCLAAMLCAVSGLISVGCCSCCEAAGCEVLLYVAVAGVKLLAGAVV